MTEALDELNGLEIRYHNAMPNWAKLIGVRIKAVPEHEGGGFAIDRKQAEAILALLSDRRADRERIAELLADLRPTLETVRLVVSPEGDSWARLSDLLDRLDAILKETGNG